MRTFFFGTENRIQEEMGYTRKLLVVLCFLVFDQASEIAKCQLAQINVERSAVEARLQTTAEAFGNRLHLLEVIINSHVIFLRFASWVTREVVDDLLRRAP